MSEKSETKESLATQRWQNRLRGWMQGLISIIIAFFFFASTWQIYSLRQRIDQAPQLALDAAFSEKISAGQEQSRALIRLEAHSIQQRYHQANIILMSRLWTTYLGFLTGMILALVGAAFILGKLREESSQISGETDFWKISIASTSPGLVMAVLGTILMLTTILTHHQIEVREGPLYVGVAESAQVPATSALPKPKDLSEVMSSVEARRAAADSSAKP